LIETLLRELAAWADNRPEIRAIVLVGSQAKGTARPESDVDLVILSERPHELLNDLTWTKQFGTAVREEIEHWGRLDSVRVWYDSGLEVEFGVATGEWASIPDEGTLAVLNDGFRVLHDRDALFARFKRPQINSG
jgi:predicted nucleotidyltransferase